MSAASETWSAHLERLAPMGLSKPQLEAIRQAGGPRRHQSRIQAAKRELQELLTAVEVDGATEGRQLIFWSVETAIAAIGEPGSANGSAPPGWYRNHPHVGARVDAALRALEELKQKEPTIDGVYATSEASGDVVVMSNDRVVARIPAHMAVLCEHLLGVSVRLQAQAFDSWLVSDQATPESESGGTLHTQDSPPPPDAAACDELARIVAKRQRVSADANT